MASSTSMISGLSSGFDWRTMVDQLIAIDHTRVDTVSTKQRSAETKLSEWQSFNTKLLAMKTAAGNIKDAEDFGIFKASMTSSSSTVSASDLIAVTPASTASAGSYSLKVNNLAAAQKLSSASFTSLSGALGTGYAGDILINGTVIGIAVTDTLTSVKDKINNANSGNSPTGVKASIISYGTGDNRLILNSASTGATGISLQNGGGTDILNSLGFADTSRTAKNHLAGGDRSDRFTSSTASIQSLLGLADTQKSVIGDVANTSGGVSTVITANTLIEDIDGFSGWAADDYILLGGKSTSNVVVSDSTFTLTAEKTVGDLLTKIESLFGDVTASITSNGKLSVVDNTPGASSLSVEVGVKNSGGTADNTLKFDTDGNLGSVVINDMSVGAIDFSTDSLSSLQAKFTAAGLTATITSETEDNITYYRLMVAGSTNTYTDESNILETLGMLKGGVSDVYGVTGNVANTSTGSAITADTLIKNIDGYTGWAADDYILLEGTKVNNGGAVSDDTFTLTAATTVGDLLAKIQSLFGDVTASITGEGKIMVVDNTTGTNTLSVKIGVKNTDDSADNTLIFDSDGNLGSAASLRKRQIVAGTDASVTVDGVTVTRSENTIDDILTGVTLDLRKADTDTTITLNIGRDIDTLMAKINTFVKSYNSISSYIHTQSSYNETEQKGGGILFADGTLSSIKSDLTSILVGSVWGVASDYATMGLIGISVDQEGALTVDDSKLRGYLATNFNDVQKLFTASGTTSVGTLAYVSHGINTKQGEYAVNITQAATKSTSAASDNTTGLSDIEVEVLTITEGTNTATVSLTGAMTMTQIANTINSELATVYTQALAGSKQLYANVLHNDEITASTKWNSMYDSDGVPASLLNNDVISFSGTSRNGTSISGSYTISSVDDDSVQGLLTAVESAFSSQVTASINASGQIVITDKTSGNSSVSLSFDNTPQAQNLDFGTVLTTNTGGQKGRYAMSITASADSGNHLVMSHDSYGTGNSFTIDQQNDLLWTGGEQTVNNGVNVEGTINGEAATGTGQTLTGNSDEANIDGLVVRYTGTTTLGEEDGETLKLTLGVAQLYDRALFNITDAFEGYISDKQQSLQNSIKGFQTQMDEMEARLVRKQEMLINRFAKMELALQKIQSQSNWLAGQLTAASNGWLSK